MGNLVEDLKRALDQVQVDMAKQDWKNAIPRAELLARNLPKSAAVHCLCAGALRGGGRLSSALSAIQRAQRLEPSNARYMHIRGNILKDCGRGDEALEVLGRAKDKLDLASGCATDYLFALNYSSELSAAGIAEEHRAFGRRLEQAVAEGPQDWSFVRESQRPLRVGFVSGDYCRHSISYFLLPLLKNLDRKRIETVGYSCSTYQDGTTAVFARTFNRWLDVTRLSDEQLAAKIREDGIDILLDLAGCTGGNRLGVFARRPAPVQASWLGYPNTTGLSRMDFRIVDETTDPAESAASLNTERLLRLPGCFLCYEGVSLDGTEERESGQPLTFGSFNYHAKISKATLEAWARILQAAPSSRLLIKNASLGDPDIVAAVKGFFFKRGVVDERLVCFGRIDLELNHLMAYGHVDLALDTFPYNGTTTTCEALWMGVPVLTVLGDRHAARVSASILKAAGLDEWAAPSVDAYVGTAAAYGNRERILPPRSSIRAQVRASALCSAAAYAEKFSVLLEKAWADKKEKEKK